MIKPAEKAPKRPSFIIELVMAYSYNLIHNNKIFKSLSFGIYMQIIRIIQIK